MTEPSKNTRAKAHAKNAAENASEAASEAKEAVTEATSSVRDGVRNGFAAVRNNEEVRQLTQGVRAFAKRAEDPALILLTAVNPLAGLGTAGIVKGTKLLARGLRAEANSAVLTDSDK